MLVMLFCILITLSAYDMEGAWIVERAEVDTFFDLYLLVQMSQKGLGTLLRVLMKMAIRMMIMRQLMMSPCQVPASGQGS